ncbi:hypothetical protein VPNG_10387 [Cytospora leucostoma]|uniref:Uncharacterized protein n=1 Tax=Cytospora leucostoma TaxID=1230097 RepID=A0A423V9H0_9PEZI|nr:hypothetical protein VPNG_10387 [Cytospora leucostoma]
MEYHLEEAITYEVAPLVHPKNLTQPISTEGLAYAEEMKDGLMNYEGMVGEGFSRWMNDGIPHYEEIVGQNKAEEERKKINLLRTGYLQGIGSSMGVVSEEAEKWQLDEFHVSAYPKAAWTRGVRDIRQIGGDFTSEGNLYGDRSAWAMLTPNGHTMMAQEVETPPCSWQKDNNSAECLESPTWQIGLAWGSPTVVTERKEKSSGFAAPKYLFEGEEILLKEVSLLAIDRPRPAGGLAPDVVIYGKADDSDDDSDYVSWTLEDQWELEDKSDTDVAAANIEWTGILKEVRQQPGCTVAAHAFTNESPIQEWVIIGRNPSGQEDPQTWVFDGFLSRHRGWAEGEVNYKGQPAQRMVYFFHWMNNEIQQRYKQEVRWATSDGRLVGRDAMKVFIYDLEEQGMLGYENHNSRFLEVTPY